ncbi:hypothetical protein FRC05_001504 [Tulasnella sp. 425]|nr:hypothetical protein FRC05_001504 [Tulasnella sp. 425]
MDTLADPLRDNLNPPPRYQLESDSEDELGGGIYGSGNILKPTHPQSPTHSFHLNGLIDGLIGKPTIIGIGTAGSQFRRAPPALSDSQDISIEADDYQVRDFPSVMAQLAYEQHTKIGTASRLSTSPVYIHISSKVPTSIHWTLSRWLLDTLKPTRQVRAGNLIDSGMTDSCRPSGQACNHRHIPNAGVHQLDLHAASSTAR